MANSENYIDTNGITIQDLSTIVTDLQDKFKAIYGSDINLEQNTADGQWTNILAQEKKDMLDFIVQVYNNMDVDTVVGLPQQVLYKLNGLEIKANTFSYCYVDVTVSKLVILDGLDDKLNDENASSYTVTDSNGNNWYLTETSTLQANTTTTLNFRAANKGSVSALAGTINTMATVVGGVTSVINTANNYITGEDGETDAEFRTRRNKSMAIPSQGFDESIVSQMLNLDDVDDCKVYDNRTDNTVNDIPPHSVWVIVRGGTSSEIGRIIYNNLPPGINMKGDEVANVVKVNGDIATINYDKPNDVDLYVMGNIKNLSGTTLDLDYIKTQLASTEFNIGQTAESSNITTLLKTTLGETGNPYEIEVSLDGINYSDIATPSGLSDYFVINKANINLTVV